MSFIPNTTPTPNWLYNGEMRKMTDTELRVVLLITRKTLGYVIDANTKRRKEKDWISQSKFMEFTGKSNRAIATAIQSCVENNWIIAREGKGELCNTAKKRSGRKIYYQLGDVFTNKLTSEDSSQVKKTSELIYKTSELNDTKPVNLVHSTKEILTKENKQKEKNIFFNDKSILEESERIRRLVQ